MIQNLKFSYIVNRAWTDVIIVESEPVHFRLSLVKGESAAFSEALRDLRGMNNEYVCATEQAEIPEGTEHFGIFDHWSGRGWDLRLVDILPGGWKITTICKDIMPQAFGLD